MTPLTKTQQQRIAKNILAACENIQLLNATGYKFLYLCGGFIAHYNIDGFKSHYQAHGSLVRALYRNESINQWGNFRIGELDAEYYHSKRDTYNLVMQALRHRVHTMMDESLHHSPAAVRPFSHQHEYL
jgi:hypothetical protein